MEKEMTKTSNASIDLVKDLRKIIDSTRQRVAIGVNAELTIMYWHIGERINRDVLGNQRAEYGRRIVSKVAEQLQETYGSKGFDEKSIPLDRRDILLEQGKTRAAERIQKYRNVNGNKIGRNKLCPCGSGKKYKKCCGRNF